MNKTLATLATCLVLASTSPAQAFQGYSARFFMDTTEKRVYAVTAAKLTTFDFHTFTIDLEAFAGVGLKDAQPTGGFSLGHTWKGASNLDLYAGLGFAVKQGEALPSSFGPVCGVTIRF